MPNWCSNKLTLTHEDPTMIAKAIAGFKAGELMQTFLPCPEELNDTVKGFVGEGQAALEAKQAANIEKYGFPTWYEFKVAMWGTKWDVGGDDCTITEISEHTVCLTFESAWSPPIEAYTKLEPLGFNITAQYYEPGMCFCGEYITGLGECSINIDGDSEWVEDNIPESVNEAFSISEQMAEWEAEEAAEEAEENLLTFTPNAV